MYLYKVPKQLISRTVPEICAAIVEALQEVIKVPSTLEEWYAVAQEYEDQWNFSLSWICRWKHCVLQAPINSGSTFFNYKSTFSIVLTGIVDAERISDGGVFENTTFYDKPQNNTLGIPPDIVLPGRTRQIPYVLAADAAFALQKHVMKPFPGVQDKGSSQRIFNYRLSRARRVVENAFGILSAVFRVLRKPMLLEPPKAAIVIQCCVYLHNFLRKSHTSMNLYTPHGSLDTEVNGNIVRGNWRESEGEQISFFPLNRIGRKSSRDYQLIREEFAEYFMSQIGTLPWQHKYA